jgi:hypothetical protein
MKRSYAVLVLLLLGLLASPSLASSQETICGPFASIDADIPSAPSTTQATTCTENNGKSCPEWLHNLIGQYPPLPESPAKQFERDPASVHFWTYRSTDEPALRSNKQVFRSKLFIATHVGGAIAMVMACRTKGSGYDCGSQATAVGAIFGLDYLQFRYVGGPNAIGAPVYEMVHYSLASTK